MVRRPGEFKATLSELVKSLPGVVWERRIADSKMVFISENVSELLGYSAKDFLEKPSLWEERVHPDWKDAYFKAHLTAIQAAKDSKTERYETKYKLLHADGHEIWVRELSIVAPLESANVPAQEATIKGFTFSLEVINSAEEGLSTVVDILNAAPSMVWYKDKENRILWVNKLAAEAIGMLPEDLIGKSTYEIYPDEAAKYHADDLEVIESETPKRGIVEPVLTSTGEKIWVRTDKIPYRDHKGEVTGVIVFASDISDLKRTEEELQEIKGELEGRVADRTRELAEANIFFTLSKDLLCIASFDGYFKRLNPNWCSFLGYSMQELLATPYIELVHPDDRARTIIAGEKLQQGLDVVDFENRYICKDGTVKWIRWSATATLGEMLIYAAAYDITAKKLAEDSLRISELRLAQLSSHVPGVIYQFLLRKDGSRSFPYISDSCRSFLEYEPEEIVNDSELVFNCIHPDDRGLLDSIIVQSAESLSDFRFEGRFITRSGKTKWVQASSSPELLENGDSIWNGLLIDVTEQKRAEEEIRQLNERLEQRVGVLAAVNKELELLTMKLELAYDEALEASKLKSEFVANISHEVRTPLSAVIGMSDLLLESNLNTEQRDYASAVRESAHSLMTIINDILDFSKVEAGKIELEKIDFSVATIVEGSADLLVPAARFKKLNLMTFIDPAVPQLVRGDPVRIRQVLVNLAGNAIKFTHEGEVVLRAFLAAQTPTNITLRFEIEDTGIGLSEAARRRLFQPFVQADGSTTRQYGGTGLGLSICKRLVELMSGSIDVSSEVDKGSVFWFTVQLESPVAQPAPEPPATTEALFGVKILVISNSETLIKVVSAYATNWSMSVDSAHSPGEALYLLGVAAREKSPYQIAIIDLWKEDTDSFELAQTIKSDTKSGDTRLLLAINRDDKERLKDAEHYGFSHAILKPLRADFLKEAFLKALDKWQGKAEESSTQEVADRDGQVLSEVSDKLVLLVEDNTIMQQLAVKQLKRLGLIVHVAANGKEAIEAFSKRAYSLILMDCQMPEMDGFETTLTIRREEAPTGAHVPIVAMTASAMEGDRENCIAAGMDDYLSKPVSFGQLVGMIKKWLPYATHATELTQETPIVQGQGDAALNESPLDIPYLQHLYGKEGFCELLESFLEEATLLLASMNDSLKSRNGRELAQSAHQLKGLAAVMGAAEIDKWSLAVEKAAKLGDWEPALLSYGALEQDCDRITKFINSYLASDKSAD